jgi:hypothetical protein
MAIMPLANAMTPLVAFAARGSPASDCLPSGTAGEHDRRAPIRQHFYRMRFSSPFHGAGIAPIACQPV